MKRCQYRWVIDTNKGSQFICWFDGSPCPDKYLFWYRPDIIIINDDIQFERPDDLTPRFWAMRGQLIDGKWNHIFTHRSGLKKHMINGQYGDIENCPTFRFIEKLKDIDPDKERRDYTYFMQFIMDSADGALFEYVMQFICDGCEERLVD